MCEVKDCEVKSNYGCRITRIRKYCKKHSRPSDIDLVNKLCIQNECHRRAAYVNKQYCGKHLPAQYICASLNCSKFAVEKLCVRHLAEKDDY